MVENNDSGPPDAPDAQGAPGSQGPGEAPAPPPALPELEELRAAAPASSEETSDTEALVLPERLAFLRNRFILGGLALVVVLLLVVIVLIAFGGGDSEAGRSARVGGASTPDSEPTVPAGGGQGRLGGRVRTTATMRNGPGPTYAILGTIPSGALVSVVGRNADETWLQVIYPPGSQLRGWVNASFIEVTADVSQLAIAGPGAGPLVAVPTRVLPVITVPPATATTTATASPPTAEVTPTGTAALTITPPPMPTSLSTATAPPLPTPLPTVTVPTMPPPTVPVKNKATPESPSE